MSVLIGTAEPSGCTHMSVQVWNEQSLGCGSRLGSWFPTGGKEMSCSHNQAEMLHEH